MSKDVMAKLSEEKKAIEKEFDEISANFAKLQEDRKAIDQKLSVIRTRQLQLQGAFERVKKLLGEDTQEVVKPQEAKSEGKK